MKYIIYNERITCKKLVKFKSASENEKALQATPCIYLTTPCIYISKELYNFLHRKLVKQLTAFQWHLESLRNVILNKHDLPFFIISIFCRTSYGERMFGKAVKMSYLIMKFEQFDNQTIWFNYLVFGVRYEIISAVYLMFILHNLVNCTSVSIIHH